MIVFRGSFKRSKRGLQAIASLLLLVPILGHPISATAVEDDATLVGSAQEGQDDRSGDFNDLFLDVAERVPTFAGA